MTDAPPDRSVSQRQQRLAGGFVGVLGVLCLFVPFWPELAPEKRLGLMLLAGAAVELFHGLRRSDPKERRGAWFGGVISVVLGLLLMNAPLLMGGMLVLGLAGWLSVDGVRHVVVAVRARRGSQPFGWSIAGAAGHFAIVAALVLLRDVGALWIVAIAVALRLFGTAAGIFRAAVHQAGAAGESVLRSLGLEDRPELQELAARLEEQDRARGPIDAFWIWTFVFTLFAIHLGRMGLDRTALGIVSPGFAVVGDLVVALIAGLGIIVPIHLVVRTVLRPLVRRAWAWCLAEPEARRHALSPRGLMRTLLQGQLRRAIRLRRASYSVRSTLRQGLQMGLPVAALIAAVTPVLGMSWYFDTENYASGIWNSWAEARTDTWREAMVRAAQRDAKAAGRPEPRFAIEPPGVTGGADFSFIVIGDTGEGDASQHVLRDQIVLAALQPEVRFVLLSSDVIYPSGEMKDYEAKFWLPFKGVQKPMYAIPGNHDWFDALEGFAATFLTPEHARTAMRARVEVDHKLTSTTDAHIEALIAKAARLRREYGVPTGFQEGPFFQFQTDRFALFAVDSGITKRLDGPQFEWFRAALESARGKFKMAILGHPLFACGEYRATDKPDFAAIHQLLREHDVRIVMAGDTHDFEYYQEAPAVGPVMHHFVNGGGGAFLTMGAQFADPATMPTDLWAFYPATAPLVAKNEANNPFWKKPMWWWMTELKAWPSAPEWVSAAFDYNVAPYFQSFAEIRVEPSKSRIRVLPWGVHGRLRWSDFQKASALVPAGVDESAPAEWIIPMD
ncbi:MAG: metallophosphoesterase [Opitutaceae bacterium]|nr:metallophosphoesterase [Opitutaceae bacterium]